MIRICAYVQESYAKQTYANECMDARQFAGLKVIIDVLERAGYNVDYAGIASVHKYDIVLMSLTSDCDWWSFIKEREKWQNGDYKVVIGGAGLLHVVPFLRWFDIAIFGRGENLILPLVQDLEKGNRYENESIMYADEFSYERIWKVQQVDTPYQHAIELTPKKTFKEGAIGCNHKCLFCGYTWQRKFVSPSSEYKMIDGLFGNIEDKELAMLDMNKHKDSVKFSLLRTTAIDGFCERLRYGVNKKISKDVMVEFLQNMIASDAKPHQLRIFNICGYPSETEADWWEYIDTLRESDAKIKQDKQWGIILNNTPFRATPATPMACAPMSKKNYRGVIGSTLGKGLKGNLIYQGNAMWSVESLGTDSLSSVMLSAIAIRGSEKDSEAIARLCNTSKFWSASANVKEATLCKYFDMDTLFGSYTPDTLPSRYLHTYAGIHKMWGVTPLELQHKQL